MPYNIAFELGHKPRGKIDENYTELRDHLNANDFVCYNYLEIPITQESLKAYDILVFVCPDYAKLSNQEIIEIVNWVKEDGGGLLLLSHAGGDRGRNSNLSELSEFFGISFENDQVLDEINNIGIENLPIITANNFIPPHPITNGINEICYRAGCSLNVHGGAFSIISSNETSEPFSCPLVCVFEPENGRICAMGSYEMFRDTTGGGFQNDEHAELGLNIFNWLISEYRMELTQHGTVQVAETAPVESDSDSTEQYTSPYSSDIDTQSIDHIERIDSSITFSSREELTGLLERYLHQINTIKDNIESLIKHINTFGDAIFEQVPEESEATEINQDISDEDVTPLSALPPKPQDFSKKGEKEKEGPTEAIIGLEPVETYERDTIEKVSDNALAEIAKSKESKSKSEAKKQPKDEKEKLQAELESLESKLNSVHNLINFIEKKHESGKLDDKSYEKQTRKLQKDLGDTENRIAKINDILEG